MEIAQHHHGAVAVIQPAGPLTQEDADELKSRMLEVRRSSLGWLVLDASTIPYVDSRGLEVLVEVAEELAQGGQALKLCGANEVLREVLELTELTSVFEHFVDVNSAVRSFL